MSDGHLEQGASTPGSAEQPTVGESLRLTRESRGESIGDVADALKLTYRQIEAMEAGRFDLLPGPAFVRGFVRNYARHLGLDPAAVLAHVERETAAPAVELSPVSNAEGTMPSGAGARPAHRPVALIVVVLVLAVAAGWYFDWFKKPEPATQIDVRPLPGAHEAPPAPGPDEEGGEAAPAPGPASGLRMSQDPPTWAPAAAPPDAFAQPAEQAASAPALASVSEGAAGVAADGERLLFRVHGESWIEVRDASGARIFSAVVPPDSTRVVEGKPPFRVVVGNAPQVGLEFRGQPVDMGRHSAGVARLTVQ